MHFFFPSYPLLPISFPSFSSGVRAHTDDKVFWTGWVLGISMGTEAVMTFRDPEAAAAPSRSGCCPCGCGGGTCAVGAAGAHLADVLLPRRSMYVMTGPARWSYTHEISPQQQLQLQEELQQSFYYYAAPGRRHGGERVSLTLRGIAPRLLPPSGQGEDRRARGGASGAEE